MNCLRCNGLMCRVNLLDHLHESGKLWAVALQCLNCGEIVDSLILKNRKGIPRPIGSQARLKRFSPVYRALSAERKVSRDT
jgi:hypothetical protein